MAFMTLNGPSDYKPQIVVNCYVVYITFHDKFI